MGRGFDPHGAHVTGLEEIHLSGDYLTHEKLWIHSLQNPDLVYRNGNFLTNEGRWRGLEWTDIREEPLDRKILIIGHSDRNVESSLVSEILEKSNPNAILASNLSVAAARNLRVADLPLGIPNDERQSKTHKIQADASLLKKAFSRSHCPSSFLDTQLYANFAVRNNPEVREAAMKAFIDIPDARRGEFVLSKRGRFSDLKAMRESGLVLCPRGAGMDTHRFWECLLVGAIPVVLESDHSARLARALEIPVITIPDWNELRDNRNLEIQWNRIHECEWDFSPLTSKFWINWLTGAADVGKAT